MSLEAINLIKESEEAGKKDKAEAASRAKQAVGDAERAGKEAVAATIARAEAESAELLKNAENYAAGRAEELASNTENKKAAMRAHAESRMDAAAAFIIERIVSD